MTVHITGKDDVGNVDTLFQEVTLGNKRGYLLYNALDNDPNGRFKQEEGGVVWISKNFPLGEACRTRFIPYELGRKILDEIEKEEKGLQNKERNR